MRRLLLRRVFPALVIVLVMAIVMIRELGIIVLTPNPFRAGFGFKWYVVTVPLMLWGLIPIILIESFVLRWRLSLGWARALIVSAVTNAVSTFVSTAILGNLSPALGLSGDRTNTGADLFAVLFLLFVPLLITSWLIEYPMARLMLRPRRWGAQISLPEPAPVDSSPPAPLLAKNPVPSLFRGMFEANVASYLFLAMVAVGLDVWIAHSPPVPSQVDAASTLHTIADAELTYWATHNKGFSPSLAALTPPPGGATPTAEAAGLIDSIIASGMKSGYRITYRPAAPDADGIIRHYTAVARPLEHRYGNYSLRSFFIDESGAIRRTDEDREATASDPLTAW